MHSRNPWVRFVTCIYWAQRRPQLARLEAVTRVHESPAELARFYEAEERVTFRDILIQCSSEWRAQKVSAA